MLLTESLLGSSSAVTNPYVEDVFSTYLYTQTSDGSTSIPLQTNVGFVSTDAWTSTVVTTGNAGYTSACAFDSSGNYYIATTLNPGSLTAYVAKYTSAGVLSWQISLTSATNYLTVKRIKVGASGDVYLAGIRESASAPFVCKLTSAGAVSWTREITGGYSRDVYMDLDSSENVHIAYTGSLTGKYARFNSSGTQDTANSKTFSTSTQTFVKGIAVDTSGNVYISGYYYDSGLLTNYGYVIKFNSSMAVQWSRALYVLSNTVATFEAVAVDTSGNVYVVGAARPATRDVIIFAKYNSSGTLQWQNQLSSSTESVQGYTLRVDSAGTLYAGCNFGSLWGLFKATTSGTVSWQKSYASTSYINPGALQGLDIDSSSSILWGVSTGTTTSANSTRAQFMKISQAGSSFGLVTDYGVLANSSLTAATSSLTAVTPSFSVSAGSSFSTVTYTGTSSSLSISVVSIPATTSTGGLFWLKSRSVAESHYLALSETSYLQSNSTSNAFAGTYVKALSSNGVVINSNSTSNTYVGWSFKKQAKFFDVVTYTGTGANRTIAHNLGSVPGCIMIKRTDTTAAWAVYHRSLANTQYMVLNTTAAAATGATYWNSTTPTSSVFSLGTSTDVNANGGTYVAYLFAHDAGGFGASGSDNVITCGSFTSTGSALPVTLGYEPQWLLFKPSSNAGSWELVDNMRGFQVDRSAATVGLEPNLSNAEAALGLVGPTSTGFTFDNGGSGVTYIYIAIRRGPMKTPTSGTSVFGLNARTGTGANATVTGGQTDDAILVKNRGRVQASLFSSRLTGTGYLSTSSTAAEAAAGTTILQASPWDVMDGVKLGTTSYFTNATADTFINYLFRRAPGFFDVVCYTGTGVARTVSHNLGVAPELMIVKNRSSATNWIIYSSALGATKYLIFDTAAASTATSIWNDTAPTASVFTVGTSGSTNGNTENHVAYLFATVAGVSKVGSYTGTGTTQQINCGFTAGARFVLIKRTDSTGDWYVWDSARGIVAGNDPYLLLNSTAAEVTGTDYVDTYSAGFEISSTAPAAINANGGSFIFLAIA